MLWVEDANLPNIYTNHCTRVTENVMLNEEGFNETDINKITSHNTRPISTITGGQSDWTKQHNTEYQASTEYSDKEYFIKQDTAIKQGTTLIHINLYVNILYMLVHYYLLFRFIKLIVN